MKIETACRLLCIIRCIEFGIRQELPLRDHRDSGSFDRVESDRNEGVFKAGLRLRLQCTDQKSSGLFFHAPCNASYLNW